MYGSRVSSASVPLGMAAKFISVVNTLYKLQSTYTEVGEKTAINVFKKIRDELLVSKLFQLSQDLYFLENRRIVD